ncbi:MAG: hypothetical protein HZB36_08375 [Candidatus Omnitrophica bacterium]|nr:hypothetical protein [Candidatus Omnitrophota bacterium]
MDLLSITISVILVLIFSAFLVISLRDIIRNKNLQPAAQDPKPAEEIKNLANQLHEARAALQEQERSANERYSKDIEKLKEECELFKKDSFEARLEVQNLNRELAAQRSAYKVLSSEHLSLREQQAVIENAQHKAEDEAQTHAKDFQKTKEELEEQYHKSLNEYEKLKIAFDEFRNGAVVEQEALGRKYQDVGFHKVAFEQLSKEHELLRRQLLDIQELHKNDQANIEDLTKKLELANQTLELQERAQKDTEKLEELLEKQITIQKTRAAELFRLEEQNKILKEQVTDLSSKLSNFSK